AAGDLGAAVKPAYTSSAYAKNVSDGIAATAGELSSQMRAAGGAASQLGSGLGQLASGIDQSATGARGLGGGASELGGGASALADGAGKLAGGVDSLASGTGDLADGLKTASTSLPSFDEQQSTKLASVIANPVKSAAEEGAMFGPTAIPLLSAVVLWFGALASFIALRAVPGNALTSRRSSIGMVLRG